MIRYCILLLLSFPCFAQKCFHKNLSKDFDFVVERSGSSSLVGDSTMVTVTVVKKESSEQQPITIISGWLYDESFVACAAVRSYTTGVNKDAESLDNDFGDLVVADFNFDGFDDLAVKREEGGNAGPLYNFYLQSKDGEFELNRFLSNEMMYFPFVIDPKKKRLITLVHGNAYQMSEKIFELKGKKNWKVISHRLVP
jgi:hypothetical protein